MQTALPPNQTPHLTRPASAFLDPSALVRAGLLSWMFGRKRTRRVTELSDFLTARGYVRVPLTRSGVGHFHAPGTLNGRAVEVMVDTGAATTVVAMSVVKELGLRAEFIDSGAGGALDQFVVHGAELRLGSLAPRLAGPAGIDFDHINAPLRAHGSAEVDVILGQDVFDAHAAVIDYPSMSLFLKAVAVEPAAS
jgi:Aspartyl protease